MYCNAEKLMCNIRDKVGFYMHENRLTICKMAEKCDLAEETICAILYRKQKDCKLATLVKLSNAMEITIDELIKNT